MTRKDHREHSINEQENKPKLKGKKKFWKKKSSRNGSRLPKPTKPNAVYTEEEPLTQNQKIRRTDKLRKQNKPKKGKKMLEREGVCDNESYKTNLPSKKSQGIHKLPKQLRHVKQKPRFGRPRLILLSRDKIDARASLLLAELLQV